MALLQRRDPLSQRVHLSKAQFALYGLAGVLITSLRRVARPRPQPQRRQAGCVSKVAAVDTQDSAAERASGSSFYTAMRIMPKAQREAMYEIYSFCRKVDDIADSTGAARSPRRAAEAVALRHRRDLLGQRR